MSEIPTMDELVAVGVVADKNSVFCPSDVRAILAAVLPLVVGPVAEMLERLECLTEGDDPDCGCDACTAIQNSRTTLSQLRALAEDVGGG